VLLSLVRAKRWHPRSGVRVSRVQMKTVRLVPNTSLEVRTNRSAAMESSEPSLDKASPGRAVARQVEIVAGNIGGLAEIAESPSYELTKHSPVLPLLYALVPVNASAVFNFSILSSALWQENSDRHHRTNGDTQSRNKQSSRMPAKNS
jgi:hypothetical protein